MNRAFSTREKVLLVILALLLIGVGYFKLLLEPINESIDNYTQLASSEQDAMLQDTAQLVQLRLMEQELEVIHESGEAVPLPAYDNAEGLLVELNHILAASTEYTLNFGTADMLDGGYIVRRPLSLQFSAKNYAAARGILTALHDSANVNQISDLSVSLPEDPDKGVQVTCSVTFYELKNG